MTAEQVLLAAIIMQMEGFSYRELAFHLMGSCACSFFVFYMSSFLSKKLDMFLRVQYAALA